MNKETKPEEPSNFESEFFKYQAGLAMHYCDLYTKAHSRHTLLLEMQGVVSTAIDGRDDNLNFLDCIATLQMQLATLATMTPVKISETINAKLQREYERKMSVKTQC